MGTQSDVFVGMKHNVLNDVLNAAGENGKLVRALLVRANDHLMADEGDAGCWTDNPWHAYKRSVVELVHDDL